MSTRGKFPPQGRGPQPKPGTPPARPPAPGVLQRKAAVPHTKPTPAAPPAYRPQPTPKVLQTKTATPTPPRPPGPTARPPRKPEVLQLKKAAAPPPPRPAPRAVAPPAAGRSRPGGVIQALKRIHDVVPPSSRVSPSAALKRYIDYLTGVAHESTMPGYLRGHTLERLEEIRQSVPETINSPSQATKVWELLNPQIATLKEYEQPEVGTTVTPSVPFVAKKRTVTPEIMNHIANGGTKEDGRPTGLHTIHGDNPIAEPFGGKTPKEFGCYVQAVRLIADNTKVKKKASTFYPDDWSLDDIREAIEYANARGGPNYEVTRPEKGRGMLLYFNGDSYFPNFD